MPRSDRCVEKGDSNEDNSDSGDNNADRRNRLRPGSLEYQVGDKPAVTLKAGDVLFIPAETIHTAKNVGSGKAAELATYIVEKGKPLLVPVN